MGNYSISMMLQQQLSIQGTEEHGLAFKEISPNWAERLGQQKQLPFPFSITWLRWYSEIRCSSKCIVGEAHGFTSFYLLSCKECKSFCVKFMNLFMLHSYSRLDKNKNLFVKHWNEKHTPHRYLLLETKR
jgi:hypothetical protein